MPQQKTLLITGASSVGGAIVGSLIGLCCGAGYIKHNKSLVGAVIAYKVILPTCVVLTAVISGVTGYLIADNYDDVEEEKKKGKE